MAGGQPLAGSLPLTKEDVMKTIKVVYANEDKSVIDIDPEFDKRIRAFFEHEGFMGTGQGVNLMTQERDLGFKELKADEEPF